MDLGLPSGTLWLDRLVGAQSPTSLGLYYQWGAVVGHTATDGFSFDETTYSEQGLDAISGDLSENQDAARAFYGSSAKMPSIAQINELLQYTSGINLSGRRYKFTSLINGNSIVVYRGGIMEGTQNTVLGTLRAWLTRYLSDTNAYSLHDSEVSTGNFRKHGLNIMAVHT